MIKSMIILDKFLTNQEIEQAEIINWRVAEVFFIADGENMSADLNAYDALYGGDINYRIDKINNTDAKIDGFNEYSVSVPMIEMVIFKGKYPSIYVLSFLAFVANEAELYYDPCEDTTSIYAPKHICLKYVEEHMKYWHNLAQNINTNKSIYH